jgi:hypothetical protein
MAAFAKSWRRERTARVPVSGCVLSTIPGSRGFLSVDRRSSGRPAACRGCWGVLRAVEDVRGHDAAALEHRGQRAARIVRPPPHDSCSPGHHRWARRGSFR